MLVFFFFKQKTAYEMRISDWSSDVCSSDLLLTWPRPPRKEPRISAKTPSHGVDLTALYALPDHEVVSGLIPGIGQRLLGIEEAVARIRATPGLIPVAIDPQREREIGRASWRERVGRYGEV